MSSVELHARRQRLWFNGQKSSELEVVPRNAFRRKGKPFLCLVAPPPVVEPLCDADLEWLYPYYPPRPKVEVAEPPLLDPAEFQPIPIRRIVKAVCDFYGVSMLDIVSERRFLEIVYARQVAYYLCYKLTTRSLKYIGNLFGHRDHTTVLWGIRKINRILPSNPKLAAEIDAIKASLIPVPTAVPIEG